MTKPRGAMGSNERHQWLVFFNVHFQGAISKGFTRESRRERKNAAARPRREWDLDAMPHGFRLCAERQSQDAADCFCCHSYGPGIGRRIGGSLFQMNSTRCLPGNASLPYPKYEMFPTIFSSINSSKSGVCLLRRQWNNGM